MIAPAIAPATLRLRLVAAAALALMAAAPAAAQGTIRAVRGLGSQRFRSADIARASGLRPGEAFSRAKVEAAQRRLGNTGAFTEVTVAMVPAGDDEIVDFGVTDAPRFFPVRFAGFAGLTSAQIAAALASIPLYHGAVPLVRLGLVHQVERALQALLRARGLSGRVTFALQAGNEGTGPTEAVVFHRE